MRFLRSHLQAVPGYTPGEQPPPHTPVIKLNTNENPYPPSPKVFAALQQVDGEILRKYPNASAQGFRQVASQIFDIPVDWITVANGSDDLLSLIVRTFVDEGQVITYPTPTYVLYRTLAQLQNARFLEIPFDADFQLPSTPLVAAQGAVTFIASPNSPSGTAIPLEQLRMLAQQVSGVLVIDEAYVDFAEADALDLVRTYDHVIIVRTLSKGYSLAGLRLGFAIAQPPLIKDLNKVKDSYSVDAIAALLGTAALQDQDHKNKNADKIKQSRTILSQRLQELGCRVWPSQTNFLWVHPPTGNAPQIQQTLKQAQILVRHFNEPGIDDKLRITIGTDAQNKTLCHHLAPLLSQ